MKTSLHQIFSNWLVQASIWLISRVGVYLLLQAAGAPALAWLSLGWTACEAARFHRDELLAAYRKLLPAARMRLEKLDTLQKLFDEGWTLSPPPQRTMRNLRAEITQQLKLAKAKTDGRQH